MLPRVILHVEVSVDGRMDWINPDLGRFYTLAARFNEDATLCGSETVLAAPIEETPADDASAVPTPDADSDDRPLLVIVDSRGRVRNWDQLLRTPYWSAGVAFCSRATPQEYLSYLDGLGIDYIVAGDYRVDLAAALGKLSESYDVETVRVDSGGTLNGVLLRECLVDEVSVILDPLLVGGESPRSFFRAEDLGSPEGAVSLRLKHLERLDGDAVWLRYEVVRLE